MTITMTMTPEEQFMRDVAYVVRRIQERALYTPTGERIEYKIQFTYLGEHPKSIPKARDEIAVIHKLEELSVLTIINQSFGMPPKTVLIDRRRIRKNFVDLELTQPKFGEVCKLLERGTRERIDPATLWRMMEEQARSMRDVADAFAKPENKPHTITEGHAGFFKFRKQGEKIGIGRDDTRKFKLLQCLCDPHFGITKTTEAVFEAIRIPKDDKNQKLRGTYDARQEMLRIIDTTIGELQKIPQLQGGRLLFHFDDMKRKIWLK